MKADSDVLAELEAICERDGGMVRPVAVVEYAADPKTALHGRFEWDDTKAAHAHRLWQAREIIQVYVDVIHDDTPPFRVFVSLKEDQRQPGGGYRRTVDVLADPERRAALLEQAKAELAHFAHNYRVLDKELAPVFAAIGKVTTRRRRVTPRKLAGVGAT